MQYWVKFFPNGEELYGFSKDEQKGRVSWSKTPCLLQGCILIEDELALQIKGIGEYWQSDTFEVPVGFGKHKPIRTKRRIMRKMASNDKEASFYRTSDQCKQTGIAVSFDSQFPPTIEVIPGKWLVLELDIQTRQVTCYYTEEKF